MLKRCLSFLRAEAVLCAALVLAAVSALAVPPDAAYADYIDWDTLLLLFSLMTVMAGFQKLGFFSRMGSRLLGWVSGTRRMLLVLVFLPFFCSMLITNDVALITFVPFAVTVLRMAEREDLLAPLVALQTVAANLGSMMTPMGNPQNLYLYAKSGMGLSAFLWLMLPYGLASGLCIGLLLLPLGNAPTPRVSLETRPGNGRGLLCCAAGFALCMLAVGNVLPPAAAAAVVAAGALILDRNLLTRVDYALLGTFLGFFIFIGNMGRVEWFRALISHALTGHEELAAVLASQVISNVPAALLLSGFTDQWEPLIIGCNLGGLGTLIASMASLISYKQISVALPAQRKRYFKLFTACNLFLLVLLLLFGVLVESLRSMG